MSTAQGGISIPKVERYLRRLEAGEVPPPIKVDNGVIVEGHHRYLAWRLFGKEPAIDPGTCYGPNCGCIFGRFKTVENQTSFLCAGRIVANFGANLCDIAGRIDFRGTRAGWCQQADTFDPLSSQQNGPTDPQLAKAIACDDSIEPPGLRRHPVDSNQTAWKTLSHSVDLFFSCSWRVANIRGRYQESGDFAMSRQPICGCPIPFRS
ncbi:MAG: hypothetical protein ACK5YR_06800, partial [Pirellula sp.]